MDKLDEENVDIADGGEITTRHRQFDVKGPLIVILIITILFVLALGIGMALVIFSRKNTPLPPLPVTEQTTPVTPTLRLGKFASDSAAMKLRGDVSAFVDETDRIDLLEPQLAPPNVDLNLNISTD